ncbi:hypothetical protein Taro_038938 [Colocasia esculenta]|uniref:X8 domain-containing protein n=1 Tax=Colocasia esculenta TaxID=4460 RepID=A0A843WNP8_COLES|nr:hypothetical protein [Colocasia esculenta]
MGDEWYCYMSWVASFQHLLFLLLMGLLSCTAADASKDNSRGRQLDVVTPMTTVPIINPTGPTITNPTVSPLTTPPASPATSTPATTPPYTTPTYMTPTIATPAVSSTGQSWCVATPTASQTALQVALDYACGYGGADCSAVQQGGSCYNPDTVRDHASYAFNNYYQKNPIPTSCDFGGTAMLTNTDPSTSTCQYPSTSTGSSVLNTTNPAGAGSTVFGSVPPSSTSEATMVSAACLPVIFTLACLLISVPIR